MYITAPPPPPNPLDEICFFGVQTGKFPGSKIIGSAELKRAPLIFQRAFRLRVIPTISCEPETGNFAKGLTGVIVS